MDLGLKELLIFGGVTLIVLVLIDAFRRFRRLKRGGLRMDLDLTGSVSGDLFNPELPSGGARQAASELSQMDSVDNEPFIPAANQDVNLMSVQSETTSTEVAQAADQYKDESVVPLSKARKQVQFSARQEPEIHSLNQQEGNHSSMGVSVDLQQPETSGPKSASTQSNQSSVSNSSSSQPEPEEILILSILASKDSSFTGPNLVRAMVSAGLRFGEHGAFHLYENQKSFQETPIISVTNGSSPGVFDLSNIQGLSTQAISLFLPLPGPNDMEASFERFLTLGDQLSKALDGRLCDDQKKPLTRAGLEMMHHRLQAVLRSVGGSVTSLDDSKQPAPLDAALEDA